MNKLTPIYLCKYDDHIKARLQQPISHTAIPPWRRCRGGHQPCHARRTSWPRTPPRSLRRRSHTCSPAIHQPTRKHHLPYTARPLQSRKLCAAQEQHRVDSRGTGHPLAVLVVESAGCRGDAEAPPGRELEHPGAAALPQGPRGRGRGVGAEALRRRRRGSHLRRLPPESCGHLQETGPGSVRGA